MKETFFHICDTIRVTPSNAYFSIYSSDFLSLQIQICCLHYTSSKKKWKFFVLEFLLTSCNAHFHKFYFTFPCITLLIEHSPNSQRPAKAIFSLRLYKSILSDLQFQKQCLDFAFLA